MRKIVVYELLSLDGVAEDPDTFFAEWDGAMARLGLVRPHEVLRLAIRRLLDWKW